MTRWYKVGHFLELSIDREVLNYVVEINNPHTNSPQPQVVHKNPIE